EAVAGADAEADSGADTDAGSEDEGGSPFEQPNSDSDAPRAMSAARPMGSTIATCSAGVVWLRPVAEGTFVELIASKRDGGRLDAREIARLVDGLASGELAEYQMAAWLMAVFFRGLDDGETVALTQAMLQSGRTLDLSEVPGIKVDKHSTGGVGDKVS